MYLVEDVHLIVTTCDDLEDVGKILGRIVLWVIDHSRSQFSSQAKVTPFLCIGLCRGVYCYIRVELYLIAKPHQPE